MKLKEPIELTPNKYTDKDNRVITPPTMTLSELEIVYVDNVPTKEYTVLIKYMPNPIVLFSGEEYSNNPDITKAQAQAKIYELANDDIQSFLQHQFPRTLEDDPYGPGSILASMFSMIGIKSTPTCSCRKHALEMNKNGIEWCEENIPTILGWLKEECNKRKIPYVETVAKMMVNKSISKAKKYREAENA